MHIGVVFPQTEFGNDPAAIRDYAQTTEGLGFTHVVAYDHVLGANPDRPGGWTGPYTHASPFHEPFVLFGFMAAVTQKLQFVPGIIILPQRQTVLVAKQAAALDVLSGGRLRLGVGLGWNEVEFIALNEDFHTRGRRIEEQVTLMRQLWTQPLVNFTGKWHTIPDAGLNPLPVQRPIPIWFGGSSDAVIKRAARLGDGWMPILSPTAAEPKLAMLYEHLKSFGRDRASFGLEGWLRMDQPDPQLWGAAAEGWKRLGAQMVMMHPMFRTPTFDGQIETLRRFKQVAGGL